MRHPIVFILAILIAPVVSLGQALADRVPGDAEIYVAWSGVDSMGPGYDQSHLKAVLDASQLPQFFHDFVPRLINRVRRNDPMAASKISQVMDIITPLAVHPSAFYFGGMDAIAPNSPPLPKVAMICDAGNDAPQIAERVSELLRSAHGSPFDCRAVGTLVVVSDFQFPEHTDSPLAQNKDFQAAMAQVGKDPVVVTYVDGVALMATVTNAVQQFAPPEAQQMWPQIRDALGIAGLKAMAATAGFDGKNWSMQMMINAPAPRTGLLAMGDAQPLAADLFKLLPVSSTVAGAGTADLNALFTHINDAIVQFSPDKGAQFQQILSQINMTLGFDIQKDFLAALGPQWGYYVDPVTAGDGMLGLTIVNRPRNADQLQTSLTSLETFTNAAIQQQMQRARANVTIQFRQTTSGGTTIHFLATPLVSPSWAIKDGTLYIGLFPQMVASAANRPADAKSIQDNPDFQAFLQKAHAPAQYMSFGYLDLPRMMPYGYQTSVAIFQVYFGVSDLMGIEAPPMLLPSLDKLLAETETAGAVGWSDDAGFYFKSIAPFPGAAMIASGGGSGMVGYSALMTSVTLPSLNRAGETANRVKCASNERMIGQAILLYSNENHGSYPPDLGTLVKTEDITLAAFVCPDSGETPPSGLTADQGADWVNAHSSYIYVGAGMKQGVDPMTVVCYEKEGAHGGDGMNFLFGDGHVEFCNRQLSQQLIEKSAKPAN